MEKQVSERSREGGQFTEPLESDGARAVRHPAEETPDPAGGGDCLGARRRRGAGGHKGWVRVTCVANVSQQY
jgi:hypothetical protein